MASTENHGDMTAHKDTYVGVMGMLKWGSVGVAIIVAAVVMIIAR
jgi:hypothetical protein